MKTSFLAIVAMLGLMSTGAHAQSIKEYRDLRMEAECSSTYRGAKWVGVFLSPVPVPVVSSLIPAVINDRCDAWYESKSWAAVRSFERKHPSIVARYNAAHGTPKSWDVTVALHVSGGG